LLSPIHAGVRRLRLDPDLRGQAASKRCRRPPLFQPYRSLALTWRGRRFFSGTAPNLSQTVFVYSRWKRCAILEWNRRHFHFMLHDP